MIDFDNITMKQAIAYYREAAANRHEKVSEHGFAWQAEAVKLLATTHSLGMTGAIALLAIPSFSTSWLLLPIGLFIMGLGLILIAMRYAAVGYFERANEISRLISKTDEFNIRGNEQEALAFAMQNIRSEPKSGQKKLNLSLWLVYGSAVILLMGTISLITTIVCHSG